MQQQQQSPHPETAWYEARLQRKRRLWSFAGIALFCAGVFLLISGLIQFPFRDAGTLVAFFALVLVLLWLGASNFLANRGPVPTREIERLRQQERSELFRQAQGTLLWQYRLWVRLVEFLLALFCLDMAAGKTVLVAPIRAEWVLGGLYFLAALLLLFDGIYLKPRRSKQAAARSARELSSRLTAGELSGETLSEPE
ncbi:MAG: hypothetical protein M3Y81_16010 [Chloroflexota bacterium]|nr:hypothetical protein [Chloroflexota bacterium]